jgi:phosphoglycolate phosphatase-like HAD superfamily hydrolase
LLRVLKRASVPHGIATSGEKKSAVPALRALRLGRSAVVVDGSEARAAKPAPELLLKYLGRLKVDVKTCFVIGDAVWDVLASAAPACWPSACLAAASAKMSSIGPVHFASIEIRPHCSIRWRI